MTGWREYLVGRGISEEVVDRYGLSGDSSKVIIPIGGFNKYRTFPNKSYFYDKGFKAALFGLKQLNGAAWCILTEGELDALVLATHNYPAVSGTGGAGTFKDEWAAQLPLLVYICYDSDEVGREAASRVGQRLPFARIIDLPAETKDVTDYFKFHSREDFDELVRGSRPVFKHPVGPPPVLAAIRPSAGDRVERAKRVPVTDYLRFPGLKAKCLWHIDAKPSMHYYKSSNKVYCFGCGKGGDVIDVVMKLKGLSFRQALDVLAPSL